MLKVGTFLQNRYEIINRIGSGGMADVYKAKDHKLNRFVAVKVLKQEFKDDKAFISKFRVEAQAAAGLAHANIVNVYDVGAENGINFIVMELVEGITLKVYIGKKGKLPVREATSIALQVCAGLEAAHNNGIVHRDVKPQNIIISLDGKAKVADFGIARAVSSDTINSNVMGSVHYSAPEQTRGGYSDAKSDIYSVGITMYEMLTGRVPFDGESTVAVALKHLQEELQSPRKLVPEIPYSTEQIVLKCTQKSPDRRYSNMTELIRDLKESLVNPEGNFVTIPTLDKKAHTILLSKEEVDQIKNSSRPSYDENLDTGAADSFSQQGNVGGEDRAYPYSGNYYQNSSYQDLKYNQEYYGKQPYPGGYGGVGQENVRYAGAGQENVRYAGAGQENVRYTGTGQENVRYAGAGQENVRYGGAGQENVRYGGAGQENARYAGQSGYPGYPYAGAYHERMNYPDEDPDQLEEDDFGPDDEYELEQQRRRKRLRRSNGDGVETRTDKVITVISIIAAVIIGCVVLVMIARTLGLFHFGEVSQNQQQIQSAQTGSSDSVDAELVQVPNLLGKTEAEAQKLLKALNLGYRYLGESPSSEYAKGQVASQSVEANSSVEKNTTVGYVISSGSAETLTVPSLANVSEEDAQKALTSMGLLVLVDNSRYSDTIQAGYVITSNPGAGSSVKAGDTVTVYVSQGQETSNVTVPDVRNHYVDDASTVLTSMGLYVYITEVYDSGVEKGLVISQDVAPGSSVSTGTAITITVSAGSQEPDIVINPQGTWMCNAQLNPPEDYNGEPVRIDLIQNGNTTTVFEGTTTFPYILHVEGEPGVAKGTAYVYMLDAQTWEVISTTSYEGITFSQVD